MCRQRKTWGCACYHITSIPNLPLSCARIKNENGGVAVPYEYALVVVCTQRSCHMMFQSPLFFVPIVHAHEWEPKTFPSAHCGTDRRRREKPWIKCTYLRACVRVPSFSTICTRPQRNVIYRYRQCG